MNKLVAKTQEGWDQVNKGIEDQSLALMELTACLKENQHTSNDHLKELKDLISTNHRQLITNIVSYKEGMEREIDNIVKGTKLILEEELRNCPSGRDLFYGGATSS